MGGMVEEDGIRYTPDDLAAKHRREEAARERQRELAAQAARAADEADEAKVTKAVRLAIEPYEERLTKLENLIGEAVDALGTRVGDLEDGNGPEVPQGDPAGVPAAEAPSGDALTASTADPAPAEDAPKVEEKPEGKTSAKRTGGGGKK